MKKVMKSKVKKEKINTSKSVWCFSCHTRKADCMVITTKGHQAACFDCVFNNDSVYSAQFKGEKELEDNYADFLKQEDKRIREEALRPKGKYKVVDNEVVSVIDKPQKRGRFTVTREVRKR